MKHIGLILAFMLLFSACQKEKRHGEFHIQGKIVEMESQAPVPDVNLKLYSAVLYDGAYLFWTEIGSATTDGSGFFQIWYNLYGGDPLLTFTSINPKYTKVRIDGGAVRNINEYFYYIVRDGGDYKMELIQE